MKINKIAAATVVPAVIAGVTVSSWAAVQAATSDPGAHAATHQVREVRPDHRMLAPWHRTAKHATHARKQASRAHAAPQALHRAGHEAHVTAGHRAHAKTAPSHAAQPAAPSPSSLLSGMSSFERCVAWRESGDNPTASSAGLFGILPATWASLGYQGTAGEASVALQKAAFNRLYAQDGTSPWAPYDGC
jgi:hypothetical protein